MAERRRLGLIAHYSKSNYGNHLVNYATRSILERCGYDVDLIVFEGGDLQRRVATLRRLPLKLVRLIAAGHLLDRILGRLRRRVGRLEQPRCTTEIDSRRLQKFVEFSNRHLNPVFYDAGNRQSLATEYQEFAIGSDQIWNYDYDLSPWHFLDFADASRTVCLSPSVGHEDIPREWQRFYRRWLSRFKEVGVRELRWTESLPSWSARPTFTMLPDPTLVLSLEDWSAVAQPVAGKSSGVLLYELGGLSEEHRAYVEEIASMNSMELTRLSAQEPGENWGSNAAEFLGMIMASSCVVTDSYHGAIFAFLFDKPLVIVPRHGFAGAMNSRIETLVQSLHLTDRLIGNLKPSTVMEHNYVAGREALTHKRAEFWQYLERHGLTPAPAHGGRDSSGGHD